MTNQDAINQYYSYFKEQLDKIKTLETPLYQNVLLVTLIDTWARAKYPKVQSDKQRFIDFITEYSDWKDCNRVSLSQLSYLLKEHRETSDGRLIKEVSVRLGKWQSGIIYRLDVDPCMPEINSFSTTDKEKKLVACSRHSDLLYTYRNHMVHEFRNPGYGMEMSNDGTSPYYHGMFDPSSSQSTWELVYPAKFLRNTAEHLLDNLKQYLQSKDIDPYSSYEFGSIWNHH